MSRGGSRKGAGRKPGLPTSTHPVRCTDDGWEWLLSQALGKGHGSVGKWADSKGRKAPTKRKGNVQGQPRRAQDVATERTRPSRWTAPFCSARFTQDYDITLATSDKDGDQESANDDKCRGVGCSCAFAQCLPQDSAAS
jgi:hypothetical protein